VTATRQRRRRTGRPSLGVTVAAALAAAALAGCGGEAEEREERPVPAVEAVPARSGALPLEEELTGVVRARNQVAIRPEIEATVVEVLVRDGAAVRRGQPLVRLDAERLREQLRQAEANVRLAEASAAEARARVAEVRAEETRTRVLAGEELVSELALETLEAQLAAARAQADQADARVEQARATTAERRSALGRTVVRSPVDGRVGRREVEAGMVVDPSSVLFLAGGLDDLVVEVPLTEEMLADVAPGTPVRVGARGLGEALQATVSRISPFLEPGSFSTRAEIDLADPAGLLPGTPVTVRVLYGESESATLVPASALWEDPRTGRRGVFVVTDSAGLVEAAGPDGGPPGELPAEPRRVELRRVEVLAEGAGVLGVTGIEPGTWVVTVGQHLLARDDAPAGADGGRPGGAERPDAAGGERPLVARVRPSSWEQVVALQSLQREDLLRGFIDKQRRVAEALGAELPASESEVDAVMRETAAGDVAVDGAADGAPRTGGS